jgi:transitional endoplasmic reticulum ATPase
LIDGTKFLFIVFDFIVGETIAQHIDNNGRFSVYEAKQIVIGVLNGLKFLHNLSIPVIHNEITNTNIMLDLSEPVPVAKIIDFGSARYLTQGSDAYMKDTINPFLCCSRNV